MSLQAFICPDRSIVSLTGEGIRTFLQRLVTCDVDRLQSDGIAYGALLTPQGKIETDFFLQEASAPGRVLVDLPAGSADGFVRKMSLYRLRAPIEIAIDDTMTVVAGDGPLADWPATARADPRSGQLGFRAILTKGDLAGLAIDQDGATDLDARRVAAGIPDGGRDILFGEHFPHDAALDLTGGVALSKGCYVGQEVISRMAHRGTARRRPVIVEAAPSAVLEEGADLCVGERIVGRIGTVAGAMALAIARIDRLLREPDGSAPALVGNAPVAVRVPGYATYAFADVAPADSADG